MRTPIPEHIAQVISRNDGMHRYLDSLPEARPYTERSWLYDGEGGNPFLEPDAVLAKWSRILKSLQAGNDFERNVYQFDISQAEKWGPQGGHEPIRYLMKDVVLPSFELGANPDTPDAFRTPEWYRAVDLTVAQLNQAGVHDLVPRSYKRVVLDMSERGTLESNSGYPDFTRRNNPNVRRAAILAAENGEWKTYPAIALFRRYNGKTRLVWMFPMAVNLVEGSWFQPLSDAIMKSSLANAFFSPWKGFEPVRSRVTEAYGKGYMVAASDFTSTDAHFQWATSLEVLKVLKRLFKPEYGDALEESVHYMHHIPLLIGSEYMLTGSHGVASGSNWTNFIETIFDMILANYLHIKIDGVFGLYAIGDDMAWASNKFQDNFKEQLEKIGLSVGQLIRADKTMVEPNKVKSLQRLFQRGYFQDSGRELRAVYPTVRALKSSIYPERFHHDWDSDYFCDRQFMILENTVDHPLFERFVAFVCKGNRHLVPFAKLKDSQLEAVHRKAKLIPGLVATYNQESRNLSFSQFKSIQIARGL